MSALTLDRRRLGTVLAVLLSGLVVALFVFRVSSAGFSATTDNNGNSWQTGSVQLTDNDGGSALFTATNLDGGTVTTKCINVTYTGFTSGTHVKMFTSGVGGTGLATYLDVVVEEGTGATDTACTGFVDDPAAPIYTGTLAAFAANNSYANGVGDWQPSGSPVTRTYKITTTVQNDSNAMGKTASATFNWEAQH